MPNRLLLLLTLATAALPAGPPAPVASCHAAPVEYGPSVAQALAEVRHVKADLFDQRSSSVLGPLPGPQQFAAAQPDRCEMFRPRTPMEYPFTDALRHDLARKYANLSFGKKARSRMAPCLPAGITGFHFRDVVQRVELVVVAIEPGSPADGKLQIDDIIIGVNGHLFDDPMDSRPELGFALMHSQTPPYGGKLVLHVVRDARPLNVTLQLPVGPSYSRCWPYDCPRTEQVADRALQCVLDHAPPAEKLFGIHGGGGFWMPLFLMASGDDRAMELVSRWAFHQARSDFSSLPDKPGGNNWSMSYNLVNLCEYYQLTGDSAVLPKIRWLVRQIELNQYKNVGTWGHGAPSGYGPINNVGLVCFTGLILAGQCGIPVDEPTLARAIRFFGKFCGTNFPYGEGSPGGRSGRMDNGMNSMAAVAFHLLGEEQMARRWARSVCYMWMGREKGHAERIFNFAWGPLGAALAPRAEFSVFMNNLLWYYELMRTRDGALAFSSYGTAGGGRLNYPAAVTSAMALALYLPRQRLRLLGAPPGPFATRPPAAMQAAADQFRNKQWAGLEQRLKTGLASADPAVRNYAAQLANAYQQLQQYRQYTLAQVRRNIQADPALAREQLEALAGRLGGMTDEMKQLADRLPDGTLKPVRKPAPPLQSVVRPQSRYFDDIKPKGPRPGKANRPAPHKR